MPPSSTSPGLLETINIIIERHMSDVHTCMPGEILDYDVATQTATVQPSLKRTIAGQTLSLPALTKVPVVFPATAHSWVRLPVAAGDKVMLHFAEGSLDRWWPNGGQVDPDIPAKFALADAIAVLGLNPKPSAIVPKGAPTSLEVVNGLGHFEITPEGRFKITNGAVDLLGLFDALLLDLQTGVMVVTGTTAQFNPATVVLLAALRGQLARIKA